MKKLILVIIALTGFLTSFVWTIALNDNNWLWIPIIILGLLLAFFLDQATLQYNDAIAAKLTDENAKLLATKFFYQWYNEQGTNTEQGFDEWWKTNRKDFIKEPDTKRIILNLQK